MPHQSPVASIYLHGVYLLMEFVTPRRVCFGNNDMRFAARVVDVRLPPLIRHG